MPERLGLRLRDEQVDLAELPVEPRDLLVEARRQLRQIGGRRDGLDATCGVVSVAVSVIDCPWSLGIAGIGVGSDQSSGIRIQPWRMA